MMYDIEKLREELVQIEQSIEGYYEGIGKLKARKKEYERLITECEALIELHDGDTHRHNS